MANSKLVKCLVKYKYLIEWQLMKFTGIMAGKLILGLLFIWYTQSFLHTVTYCDLSEINTWANGKASFRCLLKSLFWFLASYNVGAQSLSRVWLFVTLWTVAHQGPLSMGFSGQEYCNRLPCPPPGDLPSARIKPASPVLQVHSLLLTHQECCCCCC